MDGAHVRQVEQHTEQCQLWVEAVARQFDHLHRLLDALQREVLRLGGDQRLIGGYQRVDRQQPERRRAVDQDHLVVAAGVGESPPERQLATDLAAEHQLRLGQAQVGRDDVLVDRLDRLRAARQHVGDRRLHVRRQVEVVGQVALRVEVDRQRAHAAAAQDVGERAHRGRLAGASLLREDSDRVSHRPRDTRGRLAVRRARRRSRRAARPADASSANSRGTRSSADRVQLWRAVGALEAPRRRRAR